MRNIIITLLTFTLFGCSQSLLVNLEVEKDIIIRDLTKFKKDQVIDLNQEDSIVIKPNSKEFHQIQNWFKNNQDEWSHSPASFIPSYVFELNGYSFMLLKNGIVVNYIDSLGKANQLTHSISDTSFVFLGRK